MAGAVSLTEDSTDNPGVNPEGVTDDDSHLKRQLKAGERILMQVTQEKNKLQDAKAGCGIKGRPRSTGGLREGEQKASARHLW